MTRRWAILIVAVCLVVTVAAIAYAPGKTSAPEVIRAQRFELVDAEGRVLASIEEAGGTPTLCLFDETGRHHAGLMLLGGRTPGFALFDDRGTGRAALTLTDGGPMISLLDGDGKGHAILAVTDGEPGLSLSDEKSAARALVTLADGNPKLSLRDENGTSSAELEASSLTLFDKDGKVLWDAP